MDYDYYEHRSPVDIYRQSMIRRGGHRRALTHQTNQTTTGYDAYYNIIDSYCVCDAYGSSGGGDTEYNDYGPDSCEDDLTVVDADGFDCTWYATYPDYCGYWDDDNFIAQQACCACGRTDGSGCVDDFTYTDSDGYNCDWYSQNPSTCGYYDTAYFNSKEACCACADADYFDGGDDNENC